MCRRAERAGRPAGKALWASLPGILLLAASGCAHPEPQDFPIVDTHVHFWNVDEPQGIGWPGPGHPLYRTFLDQQFHPIASANQVRAAILVQSGARITENFWTLKDSETHKERYPGVVGNLSLVIGTDRFGGLFDECCRNPRYVGFRLSRGPSKEDFFNERVWEDLERLAAKGKTLDVLMGGFDLKDVDRIAGRIPRLKIMVNHGGGGPIDGGPVNPGWLADLQAAARNPNVHCKVSGFFDRAVTRPAPRTPSYYVSRLDALWEQFGEDRLVFGSDWPVTTLDGSYEDYVHVIRSYFREKGPTVCGKVFHRNAVRFYGIPPIEEAARKGDVPDPGVAR
jgi:predicted TIM-barrel fold metal-dependent hydrolase